MKKVALILCLYLYFCGCKNNDDIDCSVVTGPALKTIFIKIIDSNEINLIENNTYIANDIMIRFGDFVFTNVVFDNIPEIENLIALNLIGDDGDNTFQIELSDIDTDILVLNLEKLSDGGPCFGSTFEINSATYNEQSITVEDFNGDYIITVIK